MTSVTNVNQVKVNVVTQQQYNSMTKNANEFYMVTDATVDYSEISNTPTVDQVYDGTSTNAQSGTAVAGAISTKQDTLISGTNIKTVNNNSLLGSGNINIDSLPSQTGNNGRFLTTDGTDASWASITQLPSQSGQSGKFLTTDGTDASWATVSVGGLPSQTGNAGKYLTTDGTDASWGTIEDFTANEVETIWNSVTPTT